MSDPLPTPPTPKPPPASGGGPLRGLWRFSRALVVDQRLRWQTMFYLIIVTMVMVFVGTVFFFDWKEHPWRFVLYWLAVGWLTILVTLLAFYDLLLTRLQHRRLQRELRQRLLEQEIEKRMKDEG